MSCHPAPSDAVRAVFDAAPPDLSDLALKLRALALDVAAEEGIDRLEETLKWGEPAYLPGKRGTTLRIGIDPGRGICKLLVHCQTSLVETWRGRFGERLAFEGNRAVIVDSAQPLDEAAIRICMRDAFSYHLARV